jgi:serine/threonine protein kinase
MGTSRIEGYTVHETVGGGRTGTVCRATIEGSDADFAIKIIAKDSLSHPRLISQFEKELQAMVKCRGPHVLRLVDLLEDSSNFYIVTDFCHAGDLSRHIQTNRYLNEQQSKVLFRQIVQGIWSLHSSGFAHRDIKPENILLNNHGQVCIADFGFVVDMNDTAQVIGHCGTPGYAAPEIASGGVDYTKSDIWSAGIVLFQMISGRLPWNRAGPGPGANEEVAVPQTVSPACARFVRRILRFDPADRPSADELLGDRWLSGGSPEIEEVEPANVSCEQITEMIGGFTARQRASQLQAAQSPAIASAKKPAIKKPAQKPRPQRRGNGKSRITAPFAFREI